MEIIKKVQVLKSAEYLNKYFGYERFHVGFRYNYLAIDLLNRNKGIQNTLISGLTKREAYDYLWIMEKAILEYITRKAVK